jgi:hypothetical protein
MHSKQNPKTICTLTNPSLVFLSTTTPTPHYQIFFIEFFIYPPEQRFANGPDLVLVLEISSICVALGQLSDSLLTTV